MMDTQKVTSGLLHYLYRLEEASDTITAKGKHEKKQFV